MKDKLTFVLTADGLLVAILLVWAQLLTTTAQEFQTKGYSTFTSGFELAWVYWAILFALVSFIVVMMMYSLNRFALSLLLSSTILALLLVLFSVIPVALKVWWNRDLFSPLLYVNYPNYLRFITVLMIPPIILLVCVFLTFCLNIFRRLMDY